MDTLNDKPVMSELLAMQLIIDVLKPMSRQCQNRIINFITDSLREDCVQEIQKNKLPNHYPLESVVPIHGGIALAKENNKMVY